MGVAPVCVASTADMGSPWLKEMDEVVCVGEGPAGKSYLRSERVLQAAIQTGCSALHPGWGFLAEDPRFAALCNQHGVTFVGPSPAVIARMGLKSPAKEAVRGVGLPVIPGSVGTLDDVDEAVRIAHEIEYPIILKADAGGGGRGMRRCENESQLRDAFPTAMAEALSAFGTGRLYLEKFLTGGRHIEVQILVDAFGNGVHLYERDCSVQRNHQKLIEESPSPVLSSKEREELGARAVKAAVELGYRGAGTIEFLRSADGELFFMEMNTRLQVEHPVSELVTGIDIVCEQLKIAANQKLSFTQADVKLEGHAIECRINAEDPSANFRPSPGTLDIFELARGEGPGNIRIDTHLRAGDTIPPYYDSLIAKVLIHAETRERAVETAINTLQASRVEGVKTTIPLHLAVLLSREFLAGEYDTTSIPGWNPESTS
ncbi:MAG: acetyl-CoA carboxylase biotin carboxylase subunit [Planctomycetota bacterium]|jgi:acetyl-CoA carboxylase biotin carboxylase subunit